MVFSVNREGNEYSFECKIELFRIFYILYKKGDIKDGSVLIVILYIILKHHQPLVDGIFGIIIQSNISYNFFRMVEDRYASTAGMFAAAALITGIFSGILMSFLWPWVISHVGNQHKCLVYGTEKEFAIRFNQVPFRLINLYK